MGHSSVLDYSLKIFISSLEFNLFDPSFQIQPQLAGLISREYNPLFCPAL